MLRKNVAGQFVHIAAVNATTGAALSGATISIRRCLDGTFAAGGATITEDTGLGFYKVALTPADTNGNDCAFFFTATNMVPVCINVITTACDPTAATNFGITALPAVASGSAGAVIVSGTGTAALSVSSGLVTLAGVTHTGAVIPTVTTVTNQLTAAQIATGVWQDSTGSDFTSASSIGKSLYTSGVVPGGTNGLFIAGTNAATTITAGLTTTFTGNLTGSVGSVTGAVGSVTAGVTVTTNNDKTGYTASTVSDKTGYALTSAYDFAKGTVAVTESYAANGIAPTPVQALLAIHQYLMQFGIATTNYTVKKLDNTNPAFVVTLDSAVTPTSASRT